MVVLGRHLCVHFTLDARGVPGHRTSAFVALQARRNTPFAAASGVYLRQQDTVHVWSWPQALNDQILEKLGAEAGNASIVPESLLGQAVVDGAWLRACVVGVEALRFEAGLLKETSWWSQGPAADELANWPSQAQSLDPLQTPLDRARAGVLWSGRWRALPVAQREAQPAGRKPLWREHRLLLAGWVLLGVAAAAVGWLLREQQQLQEAVDQTQAQLDRGLATAAATANANAKARRTQRPPPAGSADEQLLAEARDATRSFQAVQVWDGLSRPLTDAGFLVREFVYERGEVKLTLVSAYAGDVDVDAAVIALEATGLWRAIEILDLSNPATVRLGARARESLFAAEMP